jgi:hypothetical protein
VEEQNCDLDAAAHKARMAVVESERDRLEASPLQLSQLINVNRKSDDGEDPYPEAVPIHLDDLSKANDSPDLYAQFHGFDGARTVYETKPGSKQYFIINEVYGDGAGSAALAKAQAPGQSDSSMHSWHATADNKLVRLTPKPRYETLSTISICGCGPNQYEVHASLSLDQAVVEYPKGIFLLPGKQVPTIHSETMTIEYVDQSIGINYVPKKGRQCQSPVC